MNTTEVYNAIKKIPEIREEQAWEIADVIADRSRMATKEDLDALESSLESRLEAKTWRIVFTVVTIMNALLFVALKFTV